MACSIRASARAEPEFPAVNPPSLSSEPATGPPTTPATTHEEDDGEQGSFRVRDEGGKHWGLLGSVVSAYLLPK